MFKERIFYHASFLRPPLFLLRLHQLRICGKVADQARTKTPGKNSRRAATAIGHPFHQETILSHLLTDRICLSHMAYILVGMSKLTAQFSAEEAAFVQAAIEAWHEKNDPEGNEFECCDNWRLCRVGDTVGEAEYEEQQRTGCCGSIDTQFGPSPGGFHYNFGFNYGH